MPYEEVLLLLFYALEVQGVAGLLQYLEHPIVRRQIRKFQQLLLLVKGVPEYYTVYCHLLDSGIDLLLRRRLQRELLLGQIHLVQDNVLYFQTLSAVRLAQVRNRYRGVVVIEVVSYPYTRKHH